MTIIKSCCIKFELVHASQVFEDNNNGLVYGINWLDDNYNVIDCEWFKSESERLKSCIETLIENEKES